MEHSIQTVKDRFNSGEPLEYVFFWGHHTKLGKMTKACFSQWFPAVFVVDDVAQLHRTVYDGGESTCVWR